MKKRIFPALLAGFLAGMMYIVACDTSNGRGGGGYRVGPTPAHAQQTGTPFLFAGNLDSAWGWVNEGRITNDTECGNIVLIEGPAEISYLQGSGLWIAPRGDPDCNSGWFVEPTERAVSSGTLVLPQGHAVVVAGQSPFIIAGHKL